MMETSLLRASDLWNALSPLAKRVIYRLAAGYGHAWANVVDEHEATSLPLYEIHARSYEQKIEPHRIYGIPMGILRPHLQDDSGEVWHVHTTTSGRLTWWVNDQHLVACLSRPSGERVFFVWRLGCQGENIDLYHYHTLVRLPDGEWVRHGEVRYGKGGLAIFCRRHMRAMREAVAAVVDPEADMTYEEIETYLAGPFARLRHRDLMALGVRALQQVENLEEVARFLEERGGDWAYDPAQALFSLKRPIYGYTFEDFESDGAEVFRDSVRDLEFEVRFVRSDAWFEITLTPAENDPMALDAPLPTPDEAQERSL